MNVRASVSVAVLLACTTVASTARAQAPDPEARIHEAVVMRQHGDDEGALRVLHEVFEQSHSAHAEAQMALAEQALGRWIEADEHLAEALASGDPWVVHHRALLDGAMNTIQSHVGSLDVRGGVPGAEVLINGRNAGTLPLAHPIHVIAGTVTLAVRAPGYESVDRRVSVTGGTMSRESVDLLALPSSAPASSASPAVMITSASAASAGLSARNHPSNVRTPLAIGAAVIAVLAAGGGLAANLERESLVSTFNGPLCEQGGQTRHTNCGYLLTDIDQLEGLAIAGYALGGALAVVAVVLQVTAPRERHEPSHALIDCGMGPGSIGFACAGRF
jgi:hypothetical protein